MEFDKLVESVATRNKKVPVWFRSMVGLIIFLPGFVFPIYWCYTFTGLYRWLVNVQIDLFGSYYPLLACVLTFLIALLPATILVYTLMALYIRFVGINDVGMDKEVIREGIPFKDKVAFNFQTRPRFTTLYILSILGIVASIYFAISTYIDSISISKAPVSVDLATTTIVKERVTQYVTMNTRLQCNDVFYFEKDKKGSYSWKTYYVPVTDANGKFKNIFLVHHTSNEIDCIDSLAPLTGIIRPAELPGLMRDEYTKLGYIIEGENYSLINQNDLPSKIERDFNESLILSAIVMALYLFLEIKYRPFSDKAYRKYILSQ